jgi:FkbM family methyltransferase
MSFVSYAQNFEDVMLWRALKHIERGFYVDIGAQDPLIDSVSLAFYERGWRGVHVEPTQQYSNKLRVARPDELILQLAIGNQPGSLTFYEFEDTGLSTADPSIARRHQEAGFRCHETVVSVISLDALFVRIGVQIIHWLKLDVEGLEKSVLESWKSDTVLPWLLIIESTQPLTQDECHKEWEHLILAKGYEFVYFDGLNRFYVSANHVDLAGAFRSPPNIFDGFVLSGTASQSFYKLVERKAQEAEIKTQEAERKAQEAQTRLASVFASTSWRITKPLRLLSIVQRRLLRESKQMSQVALRQVIATSIRFFTARPHLKRALLTRIRRHPRLEQKLRLFSAARGLASTGDAQIAIRWNRAHTLPIELKQLTPRARQIYADLKVAVEKNRQGGR